VDRAGGEPQRVVLISTAAPGDGHEASIPRAVTVAGGTAIEPLVSADGRHLLVRETRPPSAQWRVIDVRTGRQVATVPYLAGTDQPAVLGDRLYFLAPWQDRYALHACALATGAPLWHLPLDPPPDERVPALRQ
jgi:hypothetical protein